MTITGKAIATLMLFFLSTIFVIHPVYIPLRLPYSRQLRLQINLTTAPILTIAILWASQCLGPKEIRDGIVGLDGVKPYNILILFFSLAYMAITLDITGILQSAAFWVSNRGGSNVWKLFFYIYLMLTTLSAVIGNDPIILSGTAFLVYYTKVAELNPLPWLISEFAAANTASMLLFVGNPTNVVICEGFALNNAAFTAYTILPFIACSCACFIALAIQFRDAKYLPRHLTITEELDVRSVLLDPIGAWVGSILLAACLVVVIVVSFFKVDVWKITLPFAVAKLIYDFSWDHYRFANGMLERSPATPISPEESHEMDTFDAPGHHTTQPSNERQRHPSGPQINNETPSTNPSTPEVPDVPSLKSFMTRKKSEIISKHSRLSLHFPTFFTAFPRLPFALVPFAFSQFILIEGLARQGWITVFARWLVLATNRQLFPVIWVVGVIAVILCNISGTNIGATILLTKVARAADLPPSTGRAAAVSLAVASNIGAVSFTYSASLAGLLWQAILKQKGISIKQRSFAYWNALPLLLMTVVGLGVVCAEMAVLYR